MKIHKEGYGIIATTFLIYFVILLICYLCFGWHGSTKVFCIVGGALSLFITNFFRSPKRICIIDSDLVVAPCDGKVVIVQEVEENEYLKQRVLQVSVFMSIFNVHVNYYPVGGEIIYTKHHHGNYIVANHPKSSEENERTSTVVRTSNGTEVLFRQIAGYIARRIVCYAKVGENVSQCSQVGFIKFGSRMDIFLPIGTEISVKVGENVRACQTVIAKFK